MRIEVYQEEKHCSQWEEFVLERARNSHFMHTRRYLDYHAGRFDDHSLLFFGEKAAPIAVLPANRSGDVLESHGGLSFGGLLVGSRFRLNHWHEAFAAIGSHLASEGFEALDYCPPPRWYHQQPGEEDVYLLEVAGLRPALLGSAVCRIGGFFPGNSTRRNESRASGLAVAREDEALGEMIELVAETLKLRHEAAPVHTREEIELLAELFPDGIRCYTVRGDEGLIAGIIVFVSETAVKSQYVGYTNGRAMSPLYSHLFKLEEFHGRWFDFGTSMSGGGDQLDAGLFAYKESLGGMLAPVRRYRITHECPLLKPC
ncbi:MAG: GNAT family N-acetyltransferase [Verrucomicrobiales bacterium]